jgi:predicted metal-binding membrane protein
MSSPPPDGQLGSDRGTARDVVRRCYLSTTSILALAGACWFVAARQMAGMDMGAASRLGSFGFFLVLWAAMMAAMMLPGAAPAVWRRARVVGHPIDVALFVSSYLAVWTVVGIGVFAVYRPHSAVAAGIVVVAAGAYELTPLKAHFRTRCREVSHSGFKLGWLCVGSSLGLMLVLAAVSIMSLTWMSAMAGLIVAQKLVPARAAVDVWVGLAVIGLGVLIMADPSSVPGLMPPM